ncbi:hypothetical protein SPBR_04560 [Sporothrix brasiliensis 5110]|uniref:ADP-ribosylation factor GTPase-activating protein n=1 Tax=Sporothrix brasiliensis 5110 TaxID=1398154 RepID=A0A0C2EMK0_9PEZI|nr:uncharacterized protein SPBR_04560 [Sporothrix brasiliensis 5110]KIH87319.1 hypothetical protein SPBR_04560 [Sporothrix brasiliensis 5110]
MGITSSRPDEGGVLYLRDQNRLSISSLVITSARRRTSVNIAPNAFPATRVSATRSLGDNAPLEFVQDTDASAAPGPSFLLKLSNDEELTFTFTFVIRQTPTSASTVSSTNATNAATAGATAGTSAGASTATGASSVTQASAAANSGASDANVTSSGTAAAAGAASAIDTVINGLTFVQASNLREVDNLLTREFHADPNLHKNSNVELVGDFSTGGSPSVTFDWSWRWKPPKNLEDKGGGWRNSCSFVEYNQHTNPHPTPSSPTPPFLLSAPPKIRVASAQSVDSRLSSTIEAIEDAPNSPRIGIPDPIGATGATAAATVQAQPAPTTAPPPPPEPVKVDVSCPRPGDDVSVADDGPLFRATIKALEQKTGNMRMQMKKVIKRAEHAYATMVDSNEAFSSFIDALKETSSTNANAVQPAIDHYFDKIAREILAYERQNTFNLQRIVIDPLTKLYTWDIKQAEAKKRDFEEESKDYYAYVGRYLGQRQDSLKSKKLAESDTKYQTKRRNFELKRFDYSSFMQDLSGGRKEQEVLSHLTRYADGQAKSFLNTAKKVDVLLPQLEALSNEVQLADKEYQYQRREREEKRRLLEKSNGASSSAPYADSDTFSTAPTVNSNSVGVANNGTNGGPSTTATIANNATSAQSNSDSELGRADSTGSQLRVGAAPGTAGATTTDLSRSPGSLGSHHLSVGSPQQNSKFKGIRDLEERDPAQTVNLEKNGNQRKEGLLWALNRPGGHVDPRSALNKQGWHKFWIVLDQGKLSEYSNWKQKLDLHMDPIDLRMASVREARNAERRFTFEVITPQFKRVYQATSEEDMNSWISSINNALQSAMEGRERSSAAPVVPTDNGSSNFPSRDIGSVFTNKSTSLTHGHRGRDGHGIGAVGGAVAQAMSGGSSSGSGNTGIPTRRITVGGRPSAPRAPSSSYEENPDKLLQMLRDNDRGNCWCADCGSGAKVEWVSINLAIILCIECSGIHRSLGTHISKVRSLTLDITSFTTDIIELLLLVGNRVANMVWEAKLEPAAKLTPTANREQRLRFITAKYVDRAYIEPISATLSHYSTADETLLASVKKNDIQHVIYALALKANVNATDLSRGTHVVYLALAAADPASPSPTPSPMTTPRPGTSGANAGPSDPKSKQVPFPVAELLLQNGAQIPAALPAFPLSRSAQQYVEAKRGRVGGLNILDNNSGNSGSKTGSGAVAGAHPSSTPSSGVAAMERLAREKEARLQKRVSAGGRLAKSPIPER